MNILAISGSARHESTNTELLRAIKGLAPAGVELTIFHHLDVLPVFSPDAEGEKTPIEVQKFLESVSTADGIIISSPEYVRAIPGGLKNAIDWMVSGYEIISKPIVLVLSTVSDNFLEQLFLRIPLTGKSLEEIATLIGVPECESQIISFLHDFTAAIQHGSTLMPGFRK